jgi:hemerythrin-like domain-containing protein
MKRSEALAPLSRDHHLALNAARLLRRATPETSAAAVDHFRAYWAEHGDRHFDVEEQLLAPALPPGDAELAEGAARMRREHDDLRRRARVVGDAPEAELQELGTLLDAHVRFEERELFPLIEERLPDSELEALGRRIAAAEAEGPAA